MGGAIRSLTLPVDVEHFTSGWNITDMYVSFVLHSKTMMDCCDDGMKIFLSVEWCSLSFFDHFFCSLSTHSLYSLLFLLSEVTISPSLVASMRCKPSTRFHRLV
jgi:hypothetical protein